MEFAHANALLVVPPFASATMPCVAVHTLQAAAREAGFFVDVFYANLGFAAEIGHVQYEALCRSPIQYMIGERLFARAAYGLPAFGRDGIPTSIPRRRATEDCDQAVAITQADLERWEQMAVEWVDRMAERIAQRGCAVVGATSTFEQTASSIALLGRIKQKSPTTTTIIGGANCEGEMALGIASLSAQVDYVFSGEAERSFVRFLQQTQSGVDPSERIIVGETEGDLESLPSPDYSEFFQQWQQEMPGRPADEGTLWIPYESSRGCWWGQHCQCTFCGLNGHTIAYRQRSAQRVISDLKAIVGHAPTRKICMTDNNMPREFLKTFFPVLQSEIPGLELFYELKANLSLSDVETLHKAGVLTAQPGIESLSTSCLRLMKKGVTASQNIYLLRSARSTGLGLSWNILYAIPGDRIAEYESMLSILPYLRHLQPPLGVSHLSIERFSRYFAHPHEYAISNIHPLEAYDAIVPNGTLAFQIAYHFQADYPSESNAHPIVIESLTQEVEAWRRAWMNAEPPSLAVTDLGEDTYLLIDTRGLAGTQEVHLITQEQMIAAMTAQASSPQVLEWALENKLIIKIESKLVPLATARPDLFLKLESGLPNLLS